ncbi:MAG: hypothetical protein ABEK59_09795, partial [Halobacteria archaeon]
QRVSSFTKRISETAEARDYRDISDQFIEEFFSNFSQRIKGSAKAVGGITQEFVKRTAQTIARPFQPVLRPAQGAIGNLGQRFKRLGVTGQSLLGAMDKGFTVLDTWYGFYSRQKINRIDRTSTDRELLQAAKDSITAKTSTFGGVGTQFLTGNPLLALGAGILSVGHTFGLSKLFGTKDKVSNYPLYDPITSVLSGLGLGKQTQQKIAKGILVGDWTGFAGKLQEDYEQRLEQGKAVYDPLQSPSAYTRAHKNFDVSSKATRTFLGHTIKTASGEAFNLVGEKALKPAVKWGMRYIVPPLMTAGSLVAGGLAKASSMASNVVRPFVDYASRFGAKVSQYASQAGNKISQLTARLGKAVSKQAKPVLDFYAKNRRAFNISGLGLGAIAFTGASALLPDELFRRESSDKYQELSQKSKADLTESEKAFLAKAERYRRLQAKDREDLTKAQKAFLKRYREQHLDRDWLENLFRGGAGLAGSLFNIGFVSTSWNLPQVKRQRQRLGQFLKRDIQNSFRLPNFYRYQQRAGQLATQIKNLPSRLRWTFRRKFAGKLSQAKRLWGDSFQLRDLYRLKQLPDLNLKESFRITDFYRYRQKAGQQLTRLKNLPEKLAWTARRRLTGLPRLDLKGLEQAKNRWLDWLGAAKEQARIAKARTSHKIRRAIRGFGYQNRRLVSFLQEKGYRAYRRIATQTGRFQPNLDRAFSYLNQLRFQSVETFDRLRLGERLSDLVSDRWLDWLGFKTQSSRWLDRKTFDAINLVKTGWQRTRPARQALKNLINDARLKAMDLKRADLKQVLTKAGLASQEVLSALGTQTTLLKETAQGINSDLKRGLGKVRKGLLNRTAGIRTRLN